MSRVTLHSLRQALRQNPLDAIAINALGMALADLGEKEKALSYLHRAARIKPESAQFQRDIGFCLRGLNLREKAIHYHRKAIALAPHRADFYRELGILYVKYLDSREEAKKLFTRAIELSPSESSNYIELCREYVNDYPAEEALARVQQLLNSVGDIARIYHAMAFSLEEYGRYQEVKPCCLKGLKLAPNDLRILAILGRAEIALRNIDSATYYYKQAFLSYPTNPEALYSYLVHLSRMDRYREAQKIFRAYRSREGSLGLMQRSILNSKPEWDGSPLVGKAILVKNDAGYGDAIQFIRFITLLKQIGARVIVECQKPLHPLIQTMPGVDSVIVKYQECPEFEYECDPQYAGLLIDWAWETLSREIPYFRPPAYIKRLWGEKVSKKSGVKIGISWMGDLKWQMNHYRCRSMPLETLRPLTEIPGISLYSLQVDLGDQKSVEVEKPFPMIDIAAGFRDFLDTAGAIFALDLVITVDTAVAHLAGSLGKPCFLMLPYFACWRWMMDREASPWYPTMKLFRQSFPGDWPGVVSRIVKSIREFRYSQATE